MSRPDAQAEQVDRSPPGEAGTTTDATAHEDRVLAAAERLVTEGTTAHTADFVAQVALSGERRWVPWLVDVLRANQSMRETAEVGDALAAITGVQSRGRIPDLIAQGSWLAANPVDGGVGYRDFKVALYSRFDPEFGPLLASVTDQTELAAIQWGGVPVGGIPELNDPDRVPAADADHMVDDEVVLGVSIDGDAVAYPLRFLARHELTNDVVGGRPIAVVYCTLCRSALVFDRVVDDQTVRFLTSGLLLNSNKIMVDVETRTLWSHLRGIGIGGRHDGHKLTVLPVAHMRWSDWVAEHPDTHVLTTPAPIFFEEPERPPIAYDYTPGAAYASYYESPQVWFPILEAPDIWPAKTEVVGISAGDDALAVAVADIVSSETPFEVDVDGRRFTIESTGVGARVFDDSGVEVIAEHSFWFAWFATHPATRTHVFDPE